MMEAFRRWPCTAGSRQLAGRDLHVVSLERGDHIVDRQGIVCQLVGIQPDTHGVLGAELFHLPHTGHPRDHLLQVRLGIVHQVVAVHAPVFRDQTDDHQIISGGLADRDPLALDHVGQARHGELELVLYLGPARSGSMPGAKVSSMREDPAESLTADK